MKSNESDIALLEDFIRGKLDVESKELIKTRLMKEDSLKEDYQDLLILIQGSKVSKLTGKLKMLQEYAETDNANLNTQVLEMGLWKKWLAAAVVVGIIIIGAIFLKTNKTNTYPAEYAMLFEEKFETELILHKTYRASVQTDNLSPEQRRAYEIYSIKEFKKASPLLKKLWEEKKDTLALFYWGVSEIGMGKVEIGKEIMARSELDKIENRKKF